MGGTPPRRPPPRTPPGVLIVAEEPLHETRFPGESDEYRGARDDLLRAEIELRRAEETVAAKRRELPLGGEAPDDYVFDSTVGINGSATINAVEFANLQQYIRDGGGIVFMHGGIDSMQARMRNRLRLWALRCCSVLRTAAS